MRSVDGEPNKGNFGLPLGAGYRATDGLANDCLILLEAMEDLIGDGDATLNWSDSTPIGDWNGVSSRDGTSRVYSIWLRGGHDNLGGGMLSGEVPASLNGLDALEKLQLPDNDLSGGIPGPERLGRANAPGPERQLPVG